MKRIAIVGAGQRAAKFLAALARDYRSDCAVAAICDASMAMLDAKKGELAELGLAPAFFPAKEFDEMVEQVRPDTVVVLTPDFTHADYACRAMELGCDVVVEKPLTTTFENCRRLLSTQASTKRRCAVALNYRFNPAHQHIKQLLLSGAIGNVVQVTWATGVPLHHGARFFRRWHSQKAFSGSLLVHKCCHLFDLANFWLGATPQSVFARGALNLFGPAAAPRMGLEAHGPRCGECALTERCPFYMDTGSQITHNESPAAVAARGRETGYYRDMCVFREEIDTHDTLSVSTEYDTGAQLSFSWSAGRVGGGLLFRGTLGAMEYGWSEPGKIVLRTYDGATKTIEPWQAAGDHGGADPAMFKMLFGQEPPDDELGCRADLRDGVWSVLLGLSALESIETGRPVKPSERVEVARPDFLPMPSATDLIDPQPIRKVLVRRP